MFCHALQALVVEGLGFAVAQLKTILLAAPVIEKRLGPITANGSVYAEQGRQAALNLDLIRSEYPCFMGRIGRLQRDRIPALAEPL